uniref:EGF-like domain-containing protein n=1 Tax=Panagrolaimus sp. JU765 TaxID=591449 RepID=A0AC34RJZ3_9BILA
MDKKLLFGIICVILTVDSVQTLTNCADEEEKCLNGGICDAFTIGQTLFTKCSCTDDFVGQKCEFRKCPEENICQNNGICEYFGKTFVCHCPTGFSGDFCQEKLPSACDLTDCGEHGKCVLLTKSKSIAYCECNKGFTGPYCDLIDRCADQTCSERGKCFNTRFHGFYCQCDSGFDGETCEINKDDCQYNICYPGSTCIDKINGYDCECQNDRVGQFCE